MDYSRIYSELIGSATERATVLGYSEVHHILPKCLGGDDSKKNLVRLTAREHYIAHWLLYKIHRDRGTFFAWHCMSMDRDGNRYTSHTFAYARSKWSHYMREIRKGVPVSQETRLRISENRRGHKPWNLGLSYRKKDSNVKLEYLSDPKNCKFCGEVIPYSKRNNTYCSNSCAHNDPTNPKNTCEGTRVANSGSFKKGHTMDAETREKISSSMTGVQRERVACPHCEKIGDVNLMKRWHFDNCKYKGI